MLIPGITATDKPNPNEDQDKLSEQFGENDYLSITPDNENLSLVTDLTHTQIINEIPDGWMRVPRLALRLEGEYFGYQFLTALGLPAPRTQLVFDDSTGRTYIDSKVLTELTGFGYNAHHPHTQTALVNEEKFRLDPSIYVCFISELVMQEKDHFSSLIVRHNDRLYQVTYDKEHASPTKLVEASIWAAQKEAQGNYPSTLEQQFSVVHRLEAMCSNKPSVLEKIFYNSRVAATQELNTAYRDQLYKAWHENAQVIVKAYKNRYKDLYQGFVNREAIRQKIADKIVSQITTGPNVTPSTYHKELMDDLRSRCYFAEPETIDEQILSNEAELERILGAEQRRFCLQELQNKLDLVIPDAIDTDAKHLYPTPEVKDLVAFYQKQKYKFINENEANLSIDNIQELFAKFQKIIQEKQLQAQLLKALPSHRYSPEPVLSLSETDRVNLMLESFKQEASVLKNNLEQTDRPYYVEDMEFYILYGFTKKMQAKAEERSSQLHLSPQVQRDALAQVKLQKDELKKTLLPYKARRAQVYAQKMSVDAVGTMHYDVWNKVLPLLPEGVSLKRARDYYKYPLKFAYTLNIDEEIVKDDFELSAVKNYLDKLFSHFAQPEDFPKVCITQNELSFEFASIDALNKVLHAVVLDYHKIGGNADEFRKKSFIYKQRQAF